MSNPVLNLSRWGKLAELDRSPSTVMTVEGAVHKSFLLVGILLATMLAMWIQLWPGLSGFNAAAQTRVVPWLIGGLIGGAVLCLINMFTMRFVAVTSMAYAACEGLVLGGLTMFVQARFPGLPFLAAACTVGTLMALLVLYRLGVIKATPGFMRGVYVATAGIAFALLIIMLLRVFGIDPGISRALYGNGLIGIGFSIFMVGLAAANLVVDFGVIEQGAQAGAPKRMEWMAAFGLLVTLVWLYIEILNLLTKLRSRD
jgi:uncharacterized YccA/Bax inhibitor family protein